jgi:hypothetical protein
MGTLTWPSIRRGTALIKVFLACAGLVAGCEQPAGQASERAANDGRHFGYIRELQRQDDGELIVAFDAATWFFNAEAGRAAVEDGVIAGPDELPNGFYIRNLDPTVELLPLAPDADVVLLGRSEDDEGHIGENPADVITLERLFEDGALEEPRYRDAWPDAPFWIEFVAGRVERVRQQFLP